MANYTIYGLKNCDTCKKALKALEASDHNVDFVDIRAEADLAKKVPEWMAEVSADTLLNRRSTTWRELSLEQKSAAEQGGAAQLMIDNPTLIKRPVIENGADVMVGWSKDSAARL
tara:strand:+ start:219 stop:563 length:345 start_codon:yes stop_codon:yes gene_type:complete